MIGSWLRLANFSSTELMVEFGYDFLIVDMQHGEATEAQAADASGSFPRQWGDARGASAASRLSDYQSRSRFRLSGDFGSLGEYGRTGRADRKGCQISADRSPELRTYASPGPAAPCAPDYIQEANDSTAVFIIVEHILALRDFEKITAVPGIDGIFVGAFDLTFSLRESPQMQAIGDLVIREAEKAGRVPKTGSEMSRFVPYPGELFSLEILRKAKKQRAPFGIIAHSAREALAWFNRGAQWPTLHSDFAFLKGAAEAGLKGVREGLMKK